jgi:hypothetical protein
MNTVLRLHGEGNVIAHTAAVIDGKDGVAGSNLTRSTGELVNCLARAVAELARIVVQDVHSHLAAIGLRGKVGGVVLDRHIAGGANARTTAIQLHTLELLIVNDCNNGFESGGSTTFVLHLKFNGVLA